MIAMLLARFGKTAILYVIVAALLGGFVYSAYNWAFNAGYDKATQKYTAMVDKQEKAIDAKLEKLFVVSTQLVEQSSIKQEQLDKALLVIATNSAKKPLVIYKEGKCTPTATFSDSFSEINKAANQGLKGLEK